MNQALTSRVRCGDFEIDLIAGEICTPDRRILLQQQPLQVLKILIGNAGNVVTRDQIKSELWPNDTVVEFDNAINTAIRKLRAVFSDFPDQPKYIETVARRGYRLIMPVVTVDPSADPTPAAGTQAGSPDAVSRLSSLSTGMTGRTVSHYRVLEVIGGGGMGVVYRAEDLKLGRAVALKFLPEDMGSDQRALERFSREARATSCLDHPNICAIHEFGEHEGHPFIVMPLFEGQTLRDRLEAADKPFPLKELLDIAIQVCNGLQAAHEKGIIHRDIKPANIFLTRNGTCKVLDFGLAKLLDFEEKAESPAAASGSASGSTIAVGLTLSRTGVAMGTAGYMSPEQVRGENLDARSDLFSFGLVLYEMATGMRAFGGETATVVQEAILNKTVIPPQDLNSALPLKVVSIINRALEKDPEARYQNAADMIADLESLPDHSHESEIPHSRRRAVLTIAAFGSIILTLIAVGLYSRSKKPPILSERDTIVLADFTNLTGDTVFDATLWQALALQLDQSPYLNVLSEGKVAVTLKQMQQPPEQHLTPEVAAEVCLRTNSKVVLTGSIATAKDSYDVVLKAVSCQTGHPLAVVETKAQSASAVLEALGDAANQMRANLGESLASVNKFDQPLPEATTSSLEALEAFAKAKSFGQPMENQSYVKRALQLDPQFALAYAELGAYYMNVGEPTLGAENIKRAYDLRDRVSQRERFYVEVTYYALVTRQLEKAEQSGREWDQNYPGDWRPHNALGIIYAQLGQHDKAAGEMREVIRLTPENPGAYGNMINMLNTANRLAEAEAAYQESRKRGLESPYIHQFKYTLSFLQGEPAGMKEQLQWAMGKPRTEDVLLSAQSDTEAYYGHFDHAREFSQRASNSARRADAQEPAAMWKANEALREAEIGNPAGAQRAAEEALLLNVGNDVRTLAALAFARAGNVSRAQELADGLDRARPLDTMLQNYSLPTIRAAIQIQQDKSLQAVETLEVSRPYELGQGSVTYMYPVYVRGEAYLKAGQADKAVGEFQRLLAHPGVVSNFVTGALAHLQLGRAQMMMGDKVAAIDSYHEFFRLWQDAGSEIPVFSQARAEFARLKY